jgi:hypothetical protein
MMVELSAFAEKYQAYLPIAYVFEYEEADETLHALRESTGVSNIVLMRWPFSLKRDQDPCRLVA